MMKHILLIFAFAFSPSIFAGGFTVRNGAGLAEFNLEYSLLKLPSLLSACISESSCGLSTTEQRWAREILKSEKQVLEFATAEVFAKASFRVQVPDLLKQVDTSKILVNTAALYPKESSWTTLQSLAVLLELRGKSVGADEKAALFAKHILDASEAVAEMLDMKSFGYVDKGFSFIRLQTESIFVFQDDQGVQKLNTRLEKILECPTNASVARLTGIDTLSWQEAQVKNPDRVLIDAQSQVHYRCQEGSQSTSYSATLSIVLDLHVTLGSSQDFLDGKPQVRFQMSDIVFETSLISED